MSGRRIASALATLVLAIVGVAGAIGWLAILPAPLGRRIAPHSPSGNRAMPTG